MTKQEAHSLLNAVRNGVPATLGAVNKALMATGDYTRPRKDNWTNEENAVLRREWPLVGKACVHLLPGRTPRAVMGQVYVTLKLKMLPPVREVDDHYEPTTCEVTAAPKVEKPKMGPILPRRRKCHDPFGYVPPGAVRSVFEMASA